MLGGILGPGARGGRQRNISPRGTRLLRLLRLIRLLRLMRNDSLHEEDIKRNDEETGEGDTEE